MGIAPHFTPEIDVSVGMTPHRLPPFEALAPLHHQSSKNNIVSSAWCIPFVDVRSRP